MTLSLGQLGRYSQRTLTLTRGTGDSKGFDAQRDVNSLTFAATSVSAIQPSWMVTLVIATGSEGFSRSAAEAIASTTSRPFVTCPNSV